MMKIPLAVHEKLDTLMVGLPSGMTASVTAHTNGLGAWSVEVKAGGKVMSSALVDVTEFGLDKANGFRHIDR